MNLFGSALMVAAFVVAAWWTIARTRLPVVVGVLSLATLGLAVVTLAIEGVHWQLVPWQFVALASAGATSLRWWRPGHSRRWSRVLGRLGLLVSVALGGLGPLFVRVPSLPVPSGPHQVGSQVFRWTDATRAETLTPDAEDRRQVVVQAWYPTEASQGQRVPYFEAQDRLPAGMGELPTYPAWFFNDFRQVDTHAAMSPAPSTARATWPVLLFSPGWGSPREDYTGICTDLASRGYVVVALSHPYESSVALLGDGQVVGASPNAGILTANASDLIAIRAADSSFVLDQLGQLGLVEPRSTLVDHLDLQHVGIVGHSLGGATAAQAIADNPRFQVGVNIDGTLPDTLAAARLNRPFLWLQGGEQQQAGYLRVRDKLLGGLSGGGELLILSGSVHQSFTDLQAYFTPAGRSLLGDGASPEASSDITWETGDVISGFASPVLQGPADPTLEQTLVRHPSIRQERHIALVMAS